MNNIYNKFCLLFLFLLPSFLSALPLYSPTWGFFLDLPESYEFVEGNNIDRYSFQGPQRVKFDIAVYRNVHQTVGQLSGDVERRLGNTGDVAFFEYGGKPAALMELRFGDFEGWGLCVELAGGNETIFLLALSYAPKNIDMDVYHLSALNSLAPSEAERRLPGPIMEFGFPRGESKATVLAGTGMNAPVREYDAEAAQALIDREFALLTHYQFASDWQDAWIRFYRAIYRDSYDRIADAVLKLVQNWNNGIDEWAFAEKTLAWIQGFEYERDFAGSDFVNLVSAITEGRGDCDSRALLWAMILTQADIPAAIMVSRDYSHAMGLVSIAQGSGAQKSGAQRSGARFEAGGISWLVAETTARVSIGQINQEMSNAEFWLGVLFD